MKISKHKNSFMAETSDYNISFDCEAKDADFSFLSHSHSDHLFRAKKDVILSRETFELSKLRGYDYNTLKNIPSNISLLDSGHMIGSKSLFLNDNGETLMFTGDFSTKEEGIVPSFKPKKCDNLIIESTFGKPEFIFPDAKDEIKRARDFIDENMRKDYLTVLMGYPLGKIQEIQRYFKDYSKIVHPEIKRYNSVLSRMGFDFDGSDDSSPSILFSPSKNSRDEYFSGLKRKTGMKFAVFSGWNLIPSYKQRFRADEGFTISDHADFKELLNVVKKSKAKNVYVHHGYAKEFSDFLKIEGINAQH